MAKRTVPHPQNDEARYARAARTKAAAFYAQKYAGALRGIASQELLVDDDIVGLRYEDAVMRVAALQIRAIMIALSNKEECDMSRGGWACHEEFTEAEAITALTGVYALLKHAPDIIDAVRHVDCADENAVEPDLGAAQ